MNTSGTSRRQRWLDNGEALGAWVAIGVLTVDLLSARGGRF